MGSSTTLLGKSMDQKNLNGDDRTASYRRRIQEVQCPGRWLRHCFDGKCEAFLAANGNYYCTKEGLP